MGDFAGTDAAGEHIHVTCLERSSSIHQPDMTNVECLHILSTLSRQLIFYSYTAFDQLISTRTASFSPSNLYKPSVLAACQLRQTKPSSSR